MFMWYCCRARGYSSMQRWHFRVPRWYHLLWNKWREMGMLSTIKGTKCYSIPWVRSWMTKKSNYGFACPALTSSYRDLMVFYYFPCEQAVCCADKIHCCSEGTTCDVEHSKCIDSSTKKEMPMWAKLPARVRAAWENQKGQKFLIDCFAVNVKLSSLFSLSIWKCVCVCVYLNLCVFLFPEEVPVEAVNNTGTENAPKVTTANLLPPSGKTVNVSSVAKAAAGEPIPMKQIM